ncbi:flavohemoglobin expression-modulating QEGLA motif protein [Puniceibacterium confluentis]|uniref:flavohemoglobin expression-modulating QEGLA motif protein n=1 Tax=Puniceibacterium confluentis TaxID=1958944 RepID=UPI0011B46F28|nr:tyrosine/phenylalanine carboxypeptidase domain-containing protein [Puniceibacterium confluentis]
MTQAAESSDPLAAIVAALGDAQAVRETLPSGGRLHMDRPLPFICVHHQQDGARQAASDIAAAHASYLVSPDLAADTAALNRVGQAMIERFGAFLVIEVAEFERDTLLTDDSPSLPDFEIALRAEPRAETRAALEAAASAIEGVTVKYRSPVLSRTVAERPDGGALGRLSPEIGLLSIRFAPIYRQPESDAVYTELRERLIENIFDALLQAAAAFSRESGALCPQTHRALGRRAFVDAVRKLDRQMDAVCNAFDFLMAVTPINTTAAWQRFREQGEERAPQLLYRPLTMEIDAQKAALHSIAFENLEDPLLSGIYRDRQRELDLQLTAIDLRDTPRFREAGRLLYGPVEEALLSAAHDILALPRRNGQASRGQGGLEGHVDCYELRDAARQMIADYRAAYAGFEAEVVIRDDLPAGMMVSGPCLMISRSTRMTRDRVQALLSHEIGVHLMTYFTGDAQGLRIFRTGLAGYESIQEGLAVFAEYLTGGLTAGRLRLLAARVVGCAAMLDGAEFVETYRMLTRDHGFSDSAAFNLTVRLYRSGGLAKDAIYLRGLRDILDHLAAGRSLTPYWLGKFAKAQFPQIEELAARGLLTTPPITPAFLNGGPARDRLAAAAAGLSPADLVSE